MNLALLFSVLPLLACLTGCRDEAISGLGVSETTFSSSPVVIETFTVGTIDLIQGLPRVIAGAADVTNGPRGGGLSSYAGFSESQIDVDIVWVELLTDRAYSATLSLDAGDLPRTQTGSVTLVVVMGPHGLLIVADDVVETGNHRDVVAICAARAPARDVAWRKRDPLSLPGLTEALADTYPSVPADTRCPDPAR